MSDPLTRVALVFIARRINVYLRFGRPARQRTVDARRRIAEFAPGSIFCRIRWEGNAFGTSNWQLAVLRAVPSSWPMQRISGIRPGAVLLLQADGAQNVQQVLRLIDSIEARGVDTVEVPASYWRATRNRLAARVDPVPYTRERHAVYQTYRELICLRPDH